MALLHLLQPDRIDALLRIAVRLRLLLLVSRHIRQCRSPRRLLEPRSLPTARAACATGSPRSCPGKTSTRPFADLEDARCQLVDEVAVVRDENHRAGVLLQRIPAERPWRACRGGSSARRAAGSSTDAAACAPARSDCARRRESTPIGLNTSSSENRKQPSRLRSSVMRDSAARPSRQIVQHARVGIEFLVLVLREIIRLDVVARACIRPSVSGSTPASNLDQRRFPRAVHAHQRDAVAALDGEVARC